MLTNIIRTKQIYFNVFYLCIGMILNLFVSSYVFSQTKDWTYYTSQVQIQVTADEGDYLWFGSCGGGLTKLNKLTGEMKFYQMQDSGLPDNDVLALAIDSKSNKWIGTEYGSHGLTKFDDSKWKTYDITKSGIFSSNVSAITIDSLDNIWIGSYDGVAVRNADDNAWISHYNWKNSNLPHEVFVRAIAFDSKGHAWIGTNKDGLFEFDGYQWIDHRHEESKYNMITSIVIDSLDNKWIGTYSGLLKYKVIPQRNCTN